jgi:type I restriction enzyme, S subunit
MANEWRTAVLGDLTVNHDGKRKPVKESERRPGPYPYYGASGIVDYVEGYLFDGDYLLIAEDGENLRTRQTPVAFMARGKSWVNNHAHIVTGNDKADTRFLMYAIAGTDISGYLTGAVMPKLTQGNLNKIELDCPPLPEQRAIANILGMLDDKIELNCKQNETLEAMARALFKAWFVDFEPVRAKMEDRWQRGQSLPGLPAHLYDLFPDRLVESELGEIPVGWKNEPLTSSIDFKEGPGIRNWQYTNTDEGVRFINIRCIHDGDLYLGTANRISEEEANGKYAHFQLQPWDIVVSTSGTLGRSAIVRIEHLPLVLNTSVIRFRPIEGKNCFSYLYRYLNGSEFLETLEAMASGSVQRNFGPMHLKQMKLLMPPYVVVKEYEDLCRPIYEQIVCCRAQSSSLAQLRDTLLPKLISGELRVPEAERFVGLAAA